MLVAKCHDLHSLLERRGDATVDLVSSALPMPAWRWRASCFHRLLQTKKETAMSSTAADFLVDLSSAF